MKTNFTKTLVAMFAMCFASIAMRALTIIYAPTDSPNGIEFQIACFDPGFEFPSFTVDFGDGSGVITLPAGVVSILHDYPAYGNYTACFTAWGALDDSITACVEVEIVEPLPIEFTLTVDGCDVVLGLPSDPGNPLDPWEGPIFTVYWGDGDSELLTQQNTTHTYDHNGFYLICIKNGDVGFIDIYTTIEVEITGCSNTCALPTAFNHIMLDDNTIQVTSFDMPMAAGTYMEDLNFYWSFGDGTFSTEAMPSHTYPGLGDYLCCWTVECQGVQVQLYETVSINPPLLMPTEILFDVNGLTVTVTDIIIPGYTGMISDDYIFEFGWGDGTFSSGTFPSHTYPAPGEYLCCIAGWDGETGQFVGFLYLSMPIPDYEPLVMPSDILFDVNGLTVTVTDIIIPGYSGMISDDYVFEFGWGDGTFSSGTFPSHTYPATGEYLCCIAGWDGETGQFVGFLYLSMPIPDYEPLVMPSDILFEVNGLTVTVTDIIIPGYTGMISDDYVFEYSWGDGSVSSGIFLSHSYQEPGEILCCIKGYDGETGQVVGYLYIFVYPVQPDCPVAIDFSVLYILPQEDESDHIYKFEPFNFQTNPDPDIPNPWDWMFGDGSGSSEISPLHEYAADGNYEVCVHYTCPYSGEMLEACKLIQVGNSCPEEEVYVVSRFDAQVNGNIMTPFSGNAEKEREAVIQQTFWFYNNGDGTTSNTSNASHEYTYPGEYQVSQTYGVLWADGVYAEDTWSQTVMINCPGDLDGNGTRNVTDLLLFMSEFGQDCGEVLITE